MAVAARKQEVYFSGFFVLEVLVPEAIRRGVRHIRNFSQGTKSGF